MPKKAACLMTKDELLADGQKMATNQAAAKELTDNQKAQLDSLREEFDELSTGFDISLLHGANSRFSPEQRLYGVFAYVLTSSSRKASKYTGIPDRQLREWKAGSKWWPIAEKEVRRVMAEKLDAGLTALIHQTMGELEERLTNGDEVIRPDGTVMRKKVEAGKLAMILEKTIQNRALGRGEATSRREVSDTSGVVNELRLKLEELSRVSRAKEIPAEFKEIKED